MTETEKDKIEKNKTANNGRSRLLTISKAILRLLLFCGFLVALVFGYRMIQKNYYMAKAESVWDRIKKI